MGGMGGGCNACAIAHVLAKRTKPRSTSEFDLVIVDWQSRKNGMKRAAHSGLQSAGGASEQPAAPQQMSLIILSRGVVATSPHCCTLHCSSPGTRWPAGVGGGVGAGGVGRCAPLPRQRVNTSSTSSRPSSLLQSPSMAANSPSGVPSPGKVHDVQSARHR
jgi:hypothetical protein